MRKTFTVLTSFMLVIFANVAFASSGDCWTEPLPPEGTGYSCCNTPEGVHCDPATGPDS